MQVNPNYSLKWAKFNSTTTITSFTSAPGNSITDGLGNTSVDIIYSNSVQPIVVDGIVYIGALNGVLYANNGLTGGTIWSFPTNGPIVATSAFDNSVVVTGSMDGKLYGLNPTTGVKIWEYDTGYPISTSPTVQNGYVYIGNRGGEFHAIDISNGTERWAPFNVTVPAGDSATFLNNAL